MTAKIICSFYLLFIALFSFSQTGPRLIIRGDDMGFSHAGNQALIKTHKEGIEQSIEVIVPSPWFPEAVKLLAKDSLVDVGVHLVLTSEWETIRWRPITHCPSLTDSDGYFFPMIFLNKNYPGRSLKEHAWKIDEIEKEFRAQIEIALRKIPRLSHISTHMGCDHLDKQVADLIKKLAIEYHIDIDLADYKVSSVGYKGPKTTPDEKLRSFMLMLDSLQPGKTYMFLDHPALDGPEMRAIYHIGYENVAEDRQGVVDLWTNPLVIEAIRKKNIRLISYAELKK